MPRTDQGEFELVLGNKQLLSVFFIVVVLLGVFFTMGYIVGRNMAEQAAEQAALGAGQPLVIEPEGEGGAPSQTASGAASASAPAARTEPESARPKPVAAKPKPRPKPPAPPKPVSRPPVVSGGVSEPPPGTTWLQVAATTLPEGEVLRDVLSKRGFSVHLAPVPGQDLVRVLVGPVSGAEEIARTRARLRDAGFKPFTRRYR